MREGGPWPRVPGPGMGPRDIDHPAAIDLRDRVRRGIGPIMQDGAQVLRLDQVIAPPGREMRQPAFGALGVEEGVGLVAALVDGRTAELVGPGAVELRTAQRLGVVRRIDPRLRPVRPDQAPLARHPARPPVRGRTGQQPAVALDHHRDRLVVGLPDQRDTTRGARILRSRSFDLRPHPFRAGPRLARAPPAEDDPCPPVPLGRALMRQRPEFEEPRQPRQRILRERIKKRRLVPRRLEGAPVERRFLSGRLPGRGVRQFRRQNACYLRHGLSPACPWQIAGRRSSP
jgi:hypothetical protein